MAEWLHSLGPVTKGGNMMNSYSLPDRAFGYLALFLIGLIGWICDRVPAFQASTVGENHFNEGASK
jgi:hypothetical protein